MISLLLALAGSLPPQGDQQATLQSCEMTPSGWVCHYSIPAVTLLGSGDLPSQPASATMPAPPVSLPRPVGQTEAARQARLIASCADANWMSLCLPRDRREARRLRDAATAQAALRSTVTHLLSENNCPEAVKIALAGGDLALAREARDFCAP